MLETEGIRWPRSRAAGDRATSASASPARPRTPGRRRWRCAATPASRRRPRLRVARSSPPSTAASRPRASFGSSPGIPTAVAGRGADSPATCGTPTRRPSGRCSPARATRRGQRAASTVASSREEPVWQIEPTQFDAGPGRRGRARRARQRRGPTTELTSGALHDAAEVARVMPAAMMFCPSRGGISHAKGGHRGGRPEGGNRGVRRLRIQGPVGVIGRDDDIVKNGATGERVRFIRTADETGGELLVMEDHWTRPGHVVPRHIHPGIEERWTVIEGTVGTRSTGRRRSQARETRSLPRPASPIRRETPAMGQCSCASRCALLSAGKTSSASSSRSRARNSKTTWEPGRSSSSLASSSRRSSWRPRTCLTRMRNERQP